MQTKIILGTLLLLGMLGVGSEPTKTEAQGRRFTRSIVLINNADIMSGRDTTTDSFDIHDVRALTFTLADSPYSAVPDSNSIGIVTGVKDTLSSFAVFSSVDGTTFAENATLTATTATAGRHNYSLETGVTLNETSLNRSVGGLVIYMRPRDIAAANWAGDDMFGVKRARVRVASAGRRITTCQSCDSAYINNLYLEARLHY